MIYLYSSVDFMSFLSINVVMIFVFDSLFSSLQSSLSQVKLELN